MKIKSFILAAMAAVVSLISCEELMDLGTPEITISEETLNFEIAGGEQEITLKATRDWKVEMDEAAAQWLEVSPENGVGSTMDQKVVVKAFENPGATRSASIKFTIGPMGTKTLIVSQTGEQGGEVPPVVDGDYTPISTVLATSGTFEEGTVIKGYVISNMGLNNLTSKKGMYVQDATGGLQFYLSANHTFAFGDEVEIDLSGAQMGAYNGAKQISSMAVEKITKLSSGNKIEAKTVTMADFLANKYEGQYVALEGVQVKSSYLSKTWGDSSNHTSIGMEDADGNSFVVFSSKYSTYGTQTVAQGSGTIKGIASINNNNLQIIFAQESDFAGLTGARFTPAGGGEVTPPAVSGEGTEANPYSASEAMAVAAAMSDGDERANVYVEGKVAQIKEAYSAQYGNVSYYITNDGTAVDTKQMFLVYRCKYFNGENFTSEDQLKVGDEVIVVGTMVNFYGNTPELKNCNIAKLNGSSAPGTSGGEVTPPAVSGEGTEANPYSASEAMAVAAAMSDGDERANVYVEGKVAQIKEAYSAQYGNVSYYITNDGTAVDTKQMFLVYRCKYFNGENFTSEDQLKVGDEVIVVGTMVNFYGNTPELKNCHVVKVNGSGAPAAPGGDEGGSEDDGSQTPVATNSDDFSTLTASRYYEQSLTTTNGWKIVNCQVHQYGTANSGDSFAYVPEGTKAVCMNGKTSAAGSITSPVISGGCGTLSFGYCYAFSENNGVSFKVEILQNDKVVKSFDVVKTDAVKLETYSHTEDVNVAGDFTLKFTNNSPTNSTSNKDRFSIWGITWTGLTK